MRYLVTASVLDRDQITAFCDRIKQLGPQMAAFPDPGLPEWHAGISADGCVGMHPALFAKAEAELPSRGTIGSIGLGRN